MTNLQKSNQTIISICVCNEFTIAITKNDKAVITFLPIVLMIDAFEGMCKEVTEAKTKLKNTLVT